MSNSIFIQDQVTDAKKQLSDVQSLMLILNSKFEEMFKLTDMTEEDKSFMVKLTWVKGMIVNISKEAEEKLNQLVARV